MQVLIHVADAPCHGTQYHTISDNYPNGDPAGISHESMMAQVVKLDVQYWFGYIQKSNTDKMIEIFNESLCRLSEQRLLIRQFDAIQPSEVSEAVHRFVHFYKQPSHLSTYLTSRQPRDQSPCLTDFLTRKNYL